MARGYGLSATCTCTCTCRQRRDSDQDTPVIEFTYHDHDTYLNELAELYAYSEVAEFQTTMDLFHSNLTAVCGVSNWDKTTHTQKRDFVMMMLDRFEVSCNGCQPPLPPYCCILPSPSIPLLPPLPQSPSSLLSLNPPPPSSPSIPLLPPLPQSPSSLLSLNPPPPSSPSIPLLPPLPQSPSSLLSLNPPPPSSPSIPLLPPLPPPPQGCESSGSYGSCTQSPVLGQWDVQSGNVS